MVAISLPVSSIESVFPALSIGAAAAFSWLGGLRKLSEGRAIAYEDKKRTAPTPERSIVDMEGVLSRLGGDGAVLFGSDSMNRAIKIRREIALGRSGLVLGASGSGKTRWVISVILTLLDMMAAGLPLDVVVIDTKGETVTLLERWIAHLLLTWPAEKAEWLRQHVTVCKWRRDAVTPLRLYDNRGGLLSESFVAEFRTEVATEAGSSEYTDATRHLRFMHDQLLAHLHEPLDYEWAVQFYLDPSFQSAVAARITAPHLRAWVESISLTLPKVTILAFLRRLERELADPIVRVAKGLPSADADRLVPPQKPGLTLVRVARDAVLSTKAAQELAMHYYVEILNAVPLRKPGRPQLIIAEELAATLAATPKLARDVTNTLRTARSFETSVLGLAQDLENAAQTETVKSFLLNSGYVVLFQSRDEASWLVPHLPADFASGDTETQRRAAAIREIQGLPPKSFWLWVKGEPVLRGTAPSVPDPDVASGRTKEELDQVFDCEVACRSMVPIAVAEECIKTWRGQALGQKGASPVREPKKAPRVRSMDDLMRHLEGEPEDADA